MAMPGNALALLAIAVGATAQLTATSGPFSLWSSMVGLLLLSAIVAYREEIGYGTWTALAFSLITGYVLLFTIGILIDYITYGSKTTALVESVFCPADASKPTIEEVTGCLIKPRDFIMFFSWLILSLIAYVVDIFAQSVRVSR